MNDKKARQTASPLSLDMPFDEALRRFAQTKPEEVEPPAGRKPKIVKAAKRLAVAASTHPKDENKETR